MTTLRRHLLRHRLLMVWLCAAALAVRMLVPAGFMPVFANTTMVLQFCSGYGPQTMVVEIPGKAESDNQSQHGKTEMPCAFAGLSAPSLAGADPVLLALALFFVLAIGRCAVPLLRLPSRSYLRPPLRAPPARG